MNGGMSGYDMMYPYQWFASAGDSTGDINFAQASPTDGNFFNDHSQMSGTAHPADSASASPPAGTVAPHPIGTYAGYINDAVTNPGQQAPLQGGPAVMQGPTQGPWSYSAYAAALPQHYVSAAPPWKNGPMQEAAAALPIDAQAAVHSNSTNPPATPISTSHHTNPPGVLRESAAQTSAGSGGGGCAGCSGGCGGKRSSPCRGRAQQAVGLDSTNDFPPLYSHYQATPNQAVNASLYQTNSTHVPAWATAQGAPSDYEIPLQGH